MLSVALKVLLGLFAVYLVLIAALFFAQRILIYPAPSGAGLIPQAFDRINYTTSDGLMLKAGYKAATSGYPTILYFHGNGADWQSSVVATDQLVPEGYGVLAAEYRGYRGNPGSPSEEGLYNDARAAATWLAANGVAEEQIVIIGNSIGSGVATQLASETSPAALILISPFSSLKTVVKEKVRWVPASSGDLRDTYDNLAKIAAVGAPTLIMHGDADKLIGPWHSRRLATAKPDAKLIIFPDVGHELAWHPAAEGAALEFLNGLSGF